MKTLIALGAFVALCFFLTQLPYLLSVWRWLAVDIYRRIKKPPKLHLYGIWLICGLYGFGKTITMTEYLTRMRAKYGDKIYISTNYGFKGEDFPLKHWQDMIPERDKPIIFAYDEIQNDFNSRDYKNFPYQLVTMLTQNRKGNGKQIIGTAQRYGRVDKSIRELCTHVIECKRAWFGRVTKTRTYDVEDYEQYLNEVDVMKKRKIPYKKYKFIQTDSLRDSYDSFKMLESAKQKEYVTSSDKLAEMIAEFSK